MMDYWSAKDYARNNERRAQKTLKICGRLINHGHKDDALDKIAGAVVVGAIDANAVIRGLNISAADLEAAMQNIERTTNEFQCDRHPCARHSKRGLRCDLTLSSGDDADKTCAPGPHIRGHSQS